MIRRFPGIFLITLFCSLLLIGENQGGRHIFDRTVTDSR